MTSSTNFTNNGIGVGRATDANYGFAGYMQDFRVYKGIAKYTSDFVIPATSPDILPDTPSGVSGGSKLTKVTDGAGAVGFGTNGYMTTTSSDYNPGTGDFAIEGYFRFPDNSGTRRAFINETGTFGNNALVIRQYNTGFEFYCGGTSFSDSGYNMAQWNHAMITRSGSTVRIFVNGELRATRTTSQSISCNPTNQMTIGGYYSANDSEFMQGYASNLRLTVGSIPTDYQTSLTSVGVKVFTPSSEPLTSTSQGATSSDVKLLCCQSPTFATDAAVASASLSTNNTVEGSSFSPFNTDINTIRGQETGQVTLNPLSTSEATLTNGNLDYSSSSNMHTVTSTISVSSGKWYWENQRVSGGTYYYVGIADVDTDVYGNWTGSNSGYSWSVNTSGSICHNNTEGGALGSVSSIAGSDKVVGWALDMDEGTLEIYANGKHVVPSSITSPNPKNANSIVSTTDLAGRRISPAHGHSSHRKMRYNFGQKPFKYAPPDGFQPLNLANTRPETVIANPTQYVGVTTYNGSTGTGTIKDDNINFTPDFVWVKDRGGTEPHALYDTVRGAAGNGNFYRLSSNTTAGNNSPTNELTSMIRGGFTANNNGHIYYNGKYYVSWMWKAGGAPTATNTQTSGAMTANSVSLDGVLQSAYTPAGSPSKYPKKMSIGTKQGFSIVQFEGTGANATVPHGLGKPAKFMIVKNTAEATGWGVYHDAIGTATDNYIELQSDAAAGASDDAFQKTAPTSDVFSVGSKAAVNDTNDDSIAYIWCDIPGLQKFGSYTGNGDADGPFIELGFRPAVLITKRYDGGNNNWQLVDAERSPFNVANTIVKPDQNAAESTHADYAVDFLSNGFKHRTGHIARNGDGNTYLYAAWAEAPTVDLFGGGANAR